MANDFGNEDCECSAQKRNAEGVFGNDGSENEKVRQKGEKSCEKALTKVWEGDNLYKLTRAGDRRAALNLENDTEQEKRKQETVIPNELNLAGETG